MSNDQTNIEVSGLKHPLGIDWKPFLPTMSM
jgi:hypothetical protein